MIKNIQFTLYEIFGYLLPGIILFVAISIFFWIFSSRLTLPTLGQHKLELWILLLLSYFLGHIAQALGNKCEGILRLKANFFISRSKRDKIPNFIIQKVTSKINQLFGIDLEKEIKDEKDRNEWLYRICDEKVVQFGKTENRELYVYRKGFYRGSIISFFILFIALFFLFLRMLVLRESINFCGSSPSISYTVIFFLALISLVGSFFFLHRCKRFFKHHVTHALLGFLLL